MPAIPADTPTRRFITSRALCELLAVDRSTLSRLIADEGLPVVRITPQLHRYDLDAVYEWIDSRWSPRAPASDTDDQAA